MSMHNESNLLEVGTPASANGFYYALIAVAVVAVVGFAVKHRFIPNPFSFLRRAPPG